MDFLHKDLNSSIDKTYVVAADVYKNWDFRHKVASSERPQPIVDTGADLALAMGLNPHLQVLVLQGTYDLATEYMISHLNLPKELQSHIPIKYYEAGHMMYLLEPCLKKFKDDVATFISQTGGR